eukprot:TRINITY_DN8980_c0_g1_i1.p1 TRINITY_DN8980_c0_g1~~TRINITY_DN8980_c0_g1_i1.p1  ORF type:complete len:384 (+),score=77.91 TRINITY_DN8980_c0_g1_i1:92-1243(+)
MSETRIAELEDENKKLLSENQKLKSEVECLNKTIMMLARGGDSAPAGGVVLGAPPMHHHHHHHHAHHHHHHHGHHHAPVASGPPPPASSTVKSRSPKKDKGKTSRVKGEALKRHSRTPSRPPDRDRERGGNREPLLPMSGDKYLPVPIETRKRSHTSSMAASLQKTLMDRERRGAEKGKVGMMPTLWKPPESVWQRFTGTFGQNDAELEPEPPFKVQKVADLSQDKRFKQAMLSCLVFNLLVKGDIGQLPPSTLSSAARGLYRLNDGDLVKLKQSCEARPAQASHLISILYKMLTVLIWHSAESVADILDVCHRLLKKQQGSDAVGQAEMLEVSARLSHVSPLDQQIAFSTDYPPYSLPAVSKRVQAIAQKIHALLQSKMKDY